MHKHRVSFSQRFHFNIAWAWARALLRGGCLCGFIVGIFFHRISYSLANTSCDDLASQKQKVQKAEDKDLLSIMSELVDDLNRLDEVKNSVGEATGDASCREIKKELFSKLMRVDAPKSRASAEYNSLIGRFFDSQGNKAFAQESYRKAIALKTTDIAANYALAQSFRQADDSESEIMHLKRATTEEPRTELEKNLQAKSFLRLIEILDLTEGLQATNIWLQHFPNSVQARLSQIDILAKIGDWPAVEKNLSQLNKVSIPAASSWLLDFYAARVAFEQKQWSKAEVNFEKFIQGAQANKVQAEPVEASFKFLCQIQSERKYFLAARQCAERAMRSFPLNTQFKSMHESALKNGGVSRTNKIQDLEQAARLNPTSIWIKKQIITSLLNSETPTKVELSQADAQVEQLSSIESGSLDVSYWKALVAFRKKSFSTADHLFAQVLDLLRKGTKPLSSELALSEIWIYAARQERARGHAEEARQLLNEGLKMVTLRDDKDAVVKELNRMP